MKNISLSVKLIGGFVLVAMITLVVGIMGWRVISNNMVILAEMGENQLPSVWSLQIINEAVAAIQRAERTLLIPG
ncbi:MAG: MCP four helix bundle domain-containing protein [Deltaproteobacteria bacterium]|nr:MCP four helix bundle domain-containing protein [Deltaproteobacteria bacterium]